MASARDAKRGPGRPRRDPEPLRASRSEPEPSRRQFLAETLSRGVALATVAGTSPAAWAATGGRVRGRLGVLSTSEAATYGAWCEVLAPGADEAGVAQFVDAQLGEPFPDSRLLLRYLLNPPFAEFYRAGIEGIVAESRARFGKPFVALNGDRRVAVVEAAMTSSAVAWTDPDPSLFYFVSRSDAVDVVYGTVDGFRDLDIPYLAHIRPPRSW